MKMMATLIVLVFCFGSSNMENELVYTKLQTDVYEINNQYFYSEEVHTYLVELDKVLLFHIPTYSGESAKFIVSFLQKEDDTDLKLPWSSADNSYKIIGKRDKTIFSVLDLSVSYTPKAMEALEKFYGKDITTRNWNTIERIGKKIKVGR